MGARDEFGHHFEGPETLEGLLALAGCPLSADEVVDRMREGLEAGRGSDQVIPQLFESPPRFPDPSVARQLFQNLLGLWDLLQAGKPLEPPAPRPPRVKKSKPSAPPPFDASGPDPTFVEQMRQYLAALDSRALDRLQHAFENRQDALLGFLDEQALTDEVYACARALLFEVFSMGEVGWPPGVDPVPPASLARAPTEEEWQSLPPALRSYVDERLAGACEGEAAEALRGAVQRGLWALWNARRPTSGE